MKTFEEVEQVEKAKREDGTTPPDYSLEEEKYRGHLVNRLQSAKEQRDKSQKEFDGMDYLTWYETNEQADMAFIPPKLNKEDVRVVTGTTREKDNSLLSSLLNYNFEAAITAFDDLDNEVSELGTTMEDLTRKSREVEDYDGKRAIIYRELLTQGDAFLLEEWVVKTRFDKKTTFNWTDGVKIKDFDMKTDLVKDYERAEVTLLSGTKVFQGNIKEPIFKKQPYLFTCETVPYEECRQRFMGWERWESVPRKIVRFQDTMDTTGYRDWTLLPTKDNYVEVIKYFDKPNNEFMLLLNGVMMLPAKFPLSEISPSGEYPIIKGSCEQVPFFAYSKGIPAKTKVEQAVIDEMLKLAVLKTQQSFKPPMANNTGRELSSAIFVPGTTHNDIDVTKLQPIVTSTGITQGEMAFMEYLKGIIDSKSISAVFGGEKVKGQQTATQVMEMKKQALMKLGLIVWGVVQMEKEMNWSRIHTILRHWTSKVDTRVNALFKGIEDQYKKITVETTLENGQKGKKVYEFNKQKANTIQPDQLRIEEELMSMKEGQPVRKVYLNPEALKTVRLVWRVNVTPTEKDTSDLHRVLFIQNIADAAQLFGPQSLNMDYLKERYASIIKENPDKFFLKPQQQMPQMGMNSLVPGQGPVQQPGAPTAPGTPEVGGPIGTQIAKGAGQPPAKLLAK